HGLHQLRPLLAGVPRAARGARERLGRGVDVRGRAVPVDRPRRARARGRKGVHSLRRVRRGLPDRRADPRARRAGRAAGRAAGLTHAPSRSPRPAPRHRARSPERRRSVRRRPDRSCTEMRRTLLVLSTLLLTPITSAMSQTPETQRPRAREAGVVVGIMPPGPLNAITDVPGVRVGQVTVREGDAIRTGVTAILPRAGNPFRERVPAALHVGNGFGKLLGVTQLRELGELETPILLTCTLCVWRAADAMVEWLLEQPGMEDVRSINPV